jgi:hypothetical protein
VTADLRSGLRGRRRTYLTILKRAWSANFKMVWNVLLRAATSEAGARPLEGELSLQINISLGAISFEKGFSSDY